MIPVFTNHKEAIEYTRAHPEDLQLLLERYEHNKALAKFILTEQGVTPEVMDLLAKCDADRNGIIYVSEKHPGEKQ
ncbi:MAG: hypothetical protein IMZ53_01130 [Thermoplasmata archaeon]|nr:hypothetical protein [Thermoplasmata archaeon]